MNRRRRRKRKMRLEFTGWDSWDKSQDDRIRKPKEETLDELVGLVRKLAAESCNHA